MVRVEKGSALPCSPYRKEIEAVSAHHSMVRLARRELAKRVVLGGQTTRYLERNYSVLAKCARNHGYALTVHGSMLRDVDLVAIPWVRRCHAPSTLMKALKGIVLAMAGNEKVYVRINKEPTLKPHGRLGWSLYFSRDAYLDVSIAAASIRRTRRRNERYP